VPETPPGLFGGLYARGPVAAAVSDEAWLQAMLDVEAALGGPVPPATWLGGTGTYRCSL
jgi:hypothetical protein